MVSTLGFIPSSGRPNAPHQKPPRVHPLEPHWWGWTAPLKRDSLSEEGGGKGWPIRPLSLALFFLSLTAQGKYWGVEFSVKARDLCLQNLFNFFLSFPLSADEHVALNEGTTCTLEQTFDTSKYLKTRGKKSSAESSKISSAPIILPSLVTYATQ